MSDVFVTNRFVVSALAVGSLGVDVNSLSEDAAEGAGLLSLLQLGEILARPPDPASRAGSQRLLRC